MGKSSFTEDQIAYVMRQVEAGVPVAELYRKMGSREELLGMIPGMGAKMKQVKEAAPDEKELGRIVAIIDSMTRKERADAKLINGSRRKRIAAGSGTTVQDVNRLLKQYLQAEEMMKRMSRLQGGGGKKRRIPFFG